MSNKNDPYNYANAYSNQKTKDEAKEILLVVHDPDLSNYDGPNNLKEDNVGLLQVNITD